MSYLIPPQPRLQKINSKETSSKQEKHNIFLPLMDQNHQSLPQSGQKENRPKSKEKETESNIHRDSSNYLVSVVEDKIESGEDKYAKFRKQGTLQEFKRTNLFQGRQFREMRSSANLVQYKNLQTSQHVQGQSRELRKRRSTYFARRPSLVSCLENVDEVPNIQEATEIKMLVNMNKLPHDIRRSTNRESSIELMKITSTCAKQRDSLPKDSIRLANQNKGLMMAKQKQRRFQSVVEKQSLKIINCDHRDKDKGASSQVQSSSSESSEFHSENLEEDYLHRDDSIQSQLMSEADALIDNEGEVVFEDTIINQLISPTMSSGGFANYWAYLVFLAHTYNFVTVWFFLGLEGFPTNDWLNCELLSEIILLSDLIITVYIKFRLPNLWKSMWLLQSKNQTTGVAEWVCLILGSIPQSFILTLIYQHETAKLNALPIAVSRAVKLLRFNQVTKFFDTKVTEQQQNVAKCTRALHVVYIFVLATHFIGCIWLISSRIDPNQKNWFVNAKYRGDGAINNLREVTYLEIYIDAIFFVVSSMNGMGFGNIIPTTNLEWFIDILIMIAGSSTWAGFFADFTVEIYKQNQRLIDNEEKLEQAKKFSVQRALPDEMRDRIRMYYNNVRINFKVLEDKYNMLNELPLTLKTELSLFFNCELIQKVQFFQLAEPTFILALSRCMKPQICLHDDLVVEVDTVANHMFFIQNGIVQILATDNQTVIAYQSQGCYFGEIGILITEKRSCSVKAMTMCTFMVVKREELEEILNDYPYIGKFLRAVGRQRLITTKPQDLSDYEENIFDCGDGDNIILQETDFEVKRQGIQRIKQQNDRKIPSIVVNSTDSPTLHQSPSKSLRTLESKNVSNFANQNKSQVTGTDQFKNQKEIKQIFGDYPCYLTEEFKDVKKFVIIPFSVFFNLWNLVLISATFYFIFIVPYQLALNTNVLEEGGIGFKVVDILFSFVYCLDVFFRSHLAYQLNPRNESLIQTNLNMSQRYYIDNLLLLDLLAAIPLHLILLPFELSTNLTKWVMVLKLLKVARMMELIQITKRMSNISKNFITFCLFFIIQILLVHYIACGFVFVGRIEVDKKSRFDGQTMFTDVTNRNYLIAPPQISDPTFFLFRPAKEMSNIEVYIQFMYLGSCNMGAVMYGDIVPYSLPEQLYDLLAMIITRAYLAFLFGQSASYLTSIHTTVSRHSQKVNNIISWMEQNQIPLTLKQRILKYYKILWRKLQGVNKQEIINDLPQSMSTNVKSYIFKNIVQNWDIILSSQQDKGVVSSIIQNLELKIVPAGEFIIRYGETAQHMFFIINGTVSVISQEGIQLAQLGAGKNFGEMAILKEGEVRSASVLAETDVSLAVMEINDFKKICDLYSSFKIIITTVVLKRKLENQSTINTAKEETRHLKGRKNQQITENKNPKVQNILSVPDKKPDQLNFFAQIGQQVIQDNPDQLKQASVSKPRITGGFPSNPFVLSNQDTPNQKSYAELIVGPLNLQPIALNSAQIGMVNSESSHSVQAEPVIAQTKQKEAQKTRRKRKSKLVLKTGGIQDHFQNWERQSKKGTEWHKRLKSLITVTNFMRYSILGISIYNLIFIPLQLAYRIPFRDIYIVLEFATILLYLLDVFLRVKKIQSLMKTGIVLRKSSTLEEPLVEDREEFQMKIRSIKVEIICSCIASIPFSLIFNFLDIYNPVILIYFICCLRLVKILPLLKMFENVKSSNLQKWRIAEVLVYYYLLNHIFTCLWIAIALFEPDIRSTWLRRIPVPQKQGMRLENNLDDLSLASIYIHAAYFSCGTISHVAIGDITGVNNQERVVVSMAIVFGTFIYCFLFGNIVSIVSELGVFHQITYFEKYKYVMEKIDTLNLNDHTKSSINDYFNYIWGKDLDIYEEELLQDLPMAMKTDLLFCRYQQAIEDGLIFKDDTGAIDLSVTNSILNQIDVRLYMAGEFIFKVGSNRQNLYIVLQGKASLVGPCEDEDLLSELINIHCLNQDPEIIGVMKAGCHFGNDLPENISNYDNRKICHLVALQPCLVGVITPDRLNTLYQCFPNLKFKMQQINLFTFQKCEEQFIFYKNDIQDYLRSQKPRDFFTRQSLTQEKLVMEYILHHLTFSKEATYQWIWSRVKQEKSEEDLLIKQKMFYYGLKGKSFPFFDTQYLEIHKLNTQRQFNQLIERDEHSMDNGQTLRERNWVRMTIAIWSHLYIHINSKARRLFDFIQILNLIYITICTPLVVGFNIYQNSFFTNAEIVSLILSFLWILVNFRTQLIINGNYTLKFMTILNNYQKKGLWMDLIGVLPFNFIFHRMPFKNHLVLFKSLLSSVRLLSTWRGIQLFNDFEISFKSNRSSLYFQIIKAIFCIYFLGHLVACAFFFLETQLEDQSKVLWVDYNNVRGLGVDEQYLRTLYMVFNIVCTVGSGEMFAMTDLERMFYILMITCGDLFFNLAFGLITNITLMITLADDTILFKEKMYQIQDFLQSFNLDKAQQTKVESFFAFEYKNKNNPNLINYSKLEDYLPHGLREEVKFYASKQMMFKMFADINSENFLRRISRSLKPVIFLPGDFIITKGEIGNSMFFMAEGRAKVLLDDKQTIVEILEEGEYFGELALFSHSKRAVNVQADVFCVVNELRTEDFVEAAREFPGVLERVREQVFQNQSILSQIDCQSDYDPDPLKIQFMSPVSNDIDHNDKQILNQVKLFQDGELSSSLKQPAQNIDFGKKNQKHLSKDPILIEQPEISCSQSVSSSIQYSRDLDIMDKSLSRIDHNNFTNTVTDQGNTSEIDHVRRQTVVFIDIAVSQDDQKSLGIGKSKTTPFRADSHQLKRLEERDRESKEQNLDKLAGESIPDQGNLNLKQSNSNSDTQRSPQPVVHLNIDNSAQEENERFYIKKDDTQSPTSENEEICEFQNQVKSDICKQRSSKKLTQVPKTFTFVEEEREQQKLDKSMKLQIQNQQRRNTTIALSVADIQRFQKDKNPFQQPEKIILAVPNCEEDSLNGFFSPMNAPFKKERNKMLQNVNDIGKFVKNSVELDQSQHLITEDMKQLQKQKQKDDKLRYKKRNSCLQPSQVERKNLQEGFSNFLQNTSQKISPKNTTNRNLASNSSMKSRSKTFSSKKSIKQPKSFRSMKLVQVVGQKIQNKPILKKNTLNNENFQIQRKNTKSLNNQSQQERQKQQPSISFQQSPQSPKKKQVGIYKLGSGQSQQITHTLRRTYTQRGRSQPQQQQSCDQKDKSGRAEIPEDRKMQETHTSQDLSDNEQTSSPGIAEPSDRMRQNNKPMRRLSRVCLGKNLVLSQTAGLRLQWTVGY